MAIRARVTQNVIELITLPAASGINGQVTQSIVEMITLDSPNAVITQSIIEYLAALGITCDNPPSGFVGVLYSHTFPAGSGETPYTFSITSGLLPLGLTLNALTGVVSGSPQVPGPAAFTITVTDAFGATASVSCSIVIAGQVESITGGLPIAVQGCRPRNKWDWCMVLEAMRVRKIKFPPSCTIPEEYRTRYPLPWNDDFGANAIPAQALPMNANGGIITPAAAAGDTVVIAERAPKGYDGLIVGAWWRYTGSGFDEGSGDIVWRVQLGQRYLENLGAVPFAMGSPQSPMPMTEGQIILSGQTARVIVNVPNLSGMIQVGASRIAAGMIGFYWPR